MFGGLLANAETPDGADISISLDEGFRRGVEIVDTFAPVEGRASGKAIIIGNGGSAAIASHLQNDLCKAVGAAMVFNEASLLTALTNDEGYDVAFRRMVELWAEPGDLMVAVSSSGCSVNIFLAVEAAVSWECRVITFLDFLPCNPLRGMGELNFQSIQRHTAMWRGPTRASRLI